AASARAGRGRDHLFQEQFRPGDPVRGSRRHRLSEGPRGGNQQDHPHRVAWQRSHVLLPGRFPAVAIARQKERIMSILRVLLLSLAIGSSAAPANAYPVAAFYRGKRINHLSGYGTRGRYDQYARRPPHVIGE